MKKNVIILFTIGVLLLFVGILYSNLEKEKQSDNKPGDNNPIWVVVTGSNFKINYNSYDTDDLVIDYFNSTQMEVNDRYQFGISKDSSLHLLGTYKNEYNGPFIIKYYSNEDYGDFDEYLKSFYLNDTKEEYNKMNVSKWIVNDNMTVVRGQFLNDSNEFYLEKISIFYTSKNNRFSTVEYQMFNQTFSDNLIKKLVNIFKVEIDKGRYTVCDKNNNQYNCEFIVNSLNKKIKFNVDATKYHQNENMSDNKKILINDYISRFKIDEDSQIQIMLALSNDIMVDFKNINLFSDYTLSKVSLGNKTIDKYYYKSIESELYFYIIPVSENVYIMLNISSDIDKLDNVDIVAKDFINYELVDIK